MLLKANIKRGLIFLIIILAVGAGVFFYFKTLSGERDLPVEVASQLGGAGTINYYKWFQASIYNPSPWTITQLKIRVVVRGDKGKKIHDRDYIIKPEKGCYGIPFRSTIFSGKLNANRSGDRGWEWKVVGGKGFLKK